jgi:hypothetical protein
MSISVTSLVRKSDWLIESCQLGKVARRARQRGRPQSCASRGGRKVGQIVQFLGAKWCSGCQTYVLTALSAPRITFSTQFHVSHRDLRFAPRNVLGGVEPLAGVSRSLA